VQTAILVLEVQSDGSAARAKLERGDVLLDFDGAPIAGLDHLHRLLTAELAAREIRIRVLRRGKLIETAIRPMLG
jgi:S1-C subfamily serine protease